MVTSQPGEEAEVLTVEDCWKYLESSYIGRLAVINGTTPEIFPVNFVPVGRTLVFRTAPGTKLRSLLAGTPVALEADGLNLHATEVWSVVVKGIPAPISDSEVNLERAGPNLENVGAWSQRTSDSDQANGGHRAEVRRSFANAVVAASGFLLGLDLAAGVAAVPDRPVAEPSLIADHDI